MGCAKRPRGAEKADSAAIRLRRDLMAVITMEIRTRGWTQARAAEVAGITAPRMSNLTTGKLEKFSLDALVQVAASLGIEVGVRANRSFSVDAGDGMSEMVLLERSGPVIRAVLAEIAPDDLVDFEAEFRCALATADDDFDLAPVNEVMNKWWACAHLHMYPPTEEESAAVVRARAGDYTGMYERTEDGSWIKH